MTRTSRKWNRARQFLAPRRHIKYAGVQPATVKRYRQQLSRFFAYLSSNRIPRPASLEELDHEVGEYINALYQDDYPLSFGNDLVSGLKKFLPRSRLHLGTATIYMRNWSRSTKRRRRVALV